MWLRARKPKFGHHLYHKWRGNERERKEALLWGGAHVLWLTDKLSFPKVKDDEESWKFEMSEQRAAARRDRHVGILRNKIAHRKNVHAQNVTGQTCQLQCHLHFSFPSKQLHLLQGGPTLLPEIEMFSMRFERSISIFRMTSLKQHIKYFNFRCWIQVDLPVHTYVCDC